MPHRNCTRIRLSFMSMWLLTLGLFFGLGAEGWAQSTPPPQVTAIAPAPQQLLAVSPEAVAVDFSVALDPASVGSSSVILTGAGADGKLNTADDISVTPAAVSLSMPTRITIDMTGVTLTDGLYRVTLIGTGGSAITGADGKLLDGELPGALPSGDSVEGGDFISYFSVNVPFQARIELAPLTLTLIGTAGWTLPVAQTTVLTNGGMPATVLNWTAAQSGLTFTTSPASGGLSAGASLPLTVSVDTGAMTAGSYSGALQIADPDASNLAVSVAVNLTVVTDITPPGVITGFTAVAPDNLSMDLAWTNPSDVDFAGVAVFRRVGAMPTFVPVDGAAYAPGQMYGDALCIFAGAAASVTDTGLIDGTTYFYAAYAFDMPRLYAALTPASGITTIAPLPAISLSAAVLAFLATQDGPNPADQVVQLGNSGQSSSVLTWTATVSQPWLTIMPAAGTVNTTPVSLTISADLTGLSAGSHAAVVQVIDPRATNNPRQIAVTFQVNPPGMFTEVSPGLTGLGFGDLSWADMDADGDLDLLTTGQDGSNAYRTILYRNDGDGTFVSVSSGLPNVAGSSTNWADFDNDGDLDVGVLGYFPYYTQVRRNNGSPPFSLFTSMIGLGDGLFLWGDMNNDGRQDAVVFGTTTTGKHGRIYRNTGGGFTNIGAALPGLRWAKGDLGDYDNDGDLDIAVLGSTTNSSAGDWSRLYRNEGGGIYAEIDIGLPPDDDVDMQWGDYDADGDLDLLHFRSLYRNDGGGAFTSLGFTPAALTGAGFAWGDYNGDGHLDAAFVASGPEIRVAHGNGAGTFTDSGLRLPAVTQGALACGDYDGDGDLDLAIIGRENATVKHLYIYRNNYATANSPPLAPAALSETVTGSDVEFQWTAATDAETAAGGLSYNLRVGSTPGGSDIVSGMSQSDGTRLLPRLGNAQKRLSWTIKGLADGLYYWSVQSIDAGFAGSPWSSESVFLVGTTLPPVTNLTSVSGASSILLSWTNPPVPMLSGVRIVRRTDAFPTAMNDPLATAVYDGTGTTFIDFGAVEGTDYYYGVYAYDPAVTPAAGAFVQETPLDLTPPGNVISLGATAVTDTAITLDWANPADTDLAGVTIFRRVSAPPTFTPIAGTSYTPGVTYGDAVCVTTALSVSFTDNGLTPSTTYFYAAHAHDAALNYAIGVLGTATTPPASDNTPPGTVTAFFGAAGTAAASFTWTNPVDGDFAGVRIVRRVGAAPSGPNDPLGTMVYDAAGSSFVDTGLTGGLEYFYAAYAHDAGPNYAAGIVQSVTPFDVTAPTSPGGFALVAGDGSVDVAWTNPADADFAGVRILRRAGAPPTGPNDPLAAAVYDAAGTAFTDGGLTNGTTYFYGAFAYDVAGNFSGGSTASVTPTDMTPPAGVGGFAVVASGPRTVDMTWTNPGDADFGGVLILRHDGSATFIPTDGVPYTAGTVSGGATVVYSGSGAAFTDTGAAPSTPYIYQIYTYDTLLNYEAVGTSAGITTPAQPPRDDSGRCGASFSATDGHLLGALLPYLLLALLLAGRMFCSFRVRIGGA